MVWALGTQRCSSSFSCYGLPNLFSFPICIREKESDLKSWFVCGCWLVCRIAAALDLNALKRSHVSQIS